MVDNNLKLRLDDIVEFYEKDLKRIENNNIGETRHFDVQTDFMQSVGIRINEIKSNDVDFVNKLLSLENDINIENTNNRLKRINTRFGSSLSSKENMDLVNFQEIYKLVLNIKTFPIDDKRENFLDKLTSKRIVDFNTVNLFNYFKYTLENFDNKEDILTSFDKVINYELKQIKSQEKIEIIDSDLKELSKLPKTREVNSIIKDYENYKEVLITQAQMNMDLLDVIIEKYNIEDIKSL